MCHGTVRAIPHRFAVACCLSPLAILGADTVDPLCAGMSLIPPHPTLTRDASPAPSAPDCEGRVAVSAGSWCTGLTRRTASRLARLERGPVEGLCVSHSRRRSRKRAPRRSDTAVQHGTGHCTPARRIGDFYPIYRISP